MTNGQFFLSEAVEEREQAWHRQREAKIDAVDLRRRYLPEASNKVRIVGAARVDQQGIGDVVAVVPAQMGGLGRLVDECLRVAEQVDQLVAVIRGDRPSGVHRPDDAARLVAHIKRARAAIPLEQQLIGKHAFGSGQGAGHCMTLRHGNQADLRKHYRTRVPLQGGEQRGAVLIAFSHHRRRADRRTPHRDARWSARRIRGAPCPPTPRSGRCACARRAAGSGEAADPWAAPASTDVKRARGPLTEGLTVLRDLDLGDLARALEQLKGTRPRTRRWCRWSCTSCRSGKGASWSVHVSGRADDSCHSRRTEAALRSGARSPGGWPTGPFRDDRTRHLQARPRLFVKGPTSGPVSAVRLFPCSGLCCR